MSVIAHRDRSQRIAVAPEGELEGITDLIATIIDEKVDLPLLPDEDEIVIFKHLVKLLASFALAALNKKKAEEL